MLEKTIEDQEKEIEKLKKWRQEWYGNKKERIPLGTSWDDAAAGIPDGLPAAIRFGSVRVDPDLVAVVVRRRLGFPFALPHGFCDRERTVASR